jgi:hypothetical protein
MEKREDRSLCTRSGPKRTNKRLLDLIGVLPNFSEGRVGGGGHDLYCEGSCKGAGRRTVPGVEGLLSCESSNPAASKLCSICTPLYVVT